MIRKNATNQVVPIIPILKAGRVAYHCTVHPFMKGTLVVQGAKR